jgi:hypothetical protein
MVAYLRADQLEYDGDEIDPRWEMTLQKLWVVAKGWSTKVKPEQTPGDDERLEAYH